MFRCFGANVCRNSQFFLSHKLFLTFLSHETLNDDFDDLKTSGKGFYVTPWALIDYNMESLVRKEIKHQTHKILVPNHTYTMDKNSNKNKYMMILFTNTNVLANEKSVV